MPGVKAATAYIDIRLGSFQDFKSQATAKASETAQAVGAKLTQGIQKSAGLAGTEAGKAITTNAAKSIQTGAAGFTSKVKSTMSSVMNSVGMDAAKNMTKAFGIGLGALAQGDLKGFSAAMKAAGSFGSVALGSGITAAKGVVGSVLQSITTNAGSVLKAGFTKAAQAAGSAISSTFSIIGKGAASLGSAVVSGIGKLPSALSSASSALSGFARQLGLASFMATNLGLELTILATVPVLGVIAGFSKIGIAAGANLEQARASMAAFVGGLQNADKEIQFLANLAAKSPAFDTTKVIEYAKAIIGTGQSVSNTNKFLQATSNIFTTFGLSTDQASSALLGMQQVFTKGRVQGQELTVQIGQQIPIVKILADAMGLTTAKFTEMQVAGKISADQFRDAIIKAGNSAVYLNGAGVASDTLKAKFENLKEQVQTKLGFAFEKYLFPSLKKLIDQYGPALIKTIQSLAEKWLPAAGAKLQAFAQSIVDLKNKWDGLSDSTKKAIEKFLVGLVAAGPVILIVAKITQGISGLLAILGLLISPVGLVTVAIIALGVVLIKNRDEIKKFFTTTADGKAILASTETALTKIKDFLVNQMIPALKETARLTKEAITGFLQLPSTTAKAPKGQAGSSHDNDVLAPKDPSATTKAFSQLRDMVNQVAFAFTKSLKPAWDQIVSTLKDFGLNLPKNITWMQVLKVVLVAVAAVLGGVLVTSLATVSFAVNLLTGVFRVLADVVLGAWNVIEGVVKFFNDALTGNFSKLGGDLMQIWNGLWMLVVGTIWDTIMTIVNAVSGFVNTIYGFFAWLYDVLVGHSVVPDMVKAIISWFARLPGAIIGIVAGLVGSIAGFFSAMMSNAINAVSNGISGIVGKVSEIKSRIVSAASGFGSLLINAGKDIMNGLIHGVDSMVSTLTSKLSALTALIPKLKGPPEKDRVMLYGAGQLIMKGLIHGIDDGTPALVHSLTGVSNVIRNTPVFNPVGGVSFPSSGSMASAGNTTVNVNVPAPVTDPAAIADYTVRRMNSSLATRAI